MRITVAALALAAAAAAPAAVAADAPEFDLPVRCAMGAVCTVQKLFDHDPGPGLRDYACGRLATDAHEGIDIRVPSLVEMAAGVPVVAAAPGVVAAVRDGMPDIDVERTGAATIGARMAGNGVVIEHGGGWVTQYSHLRRGSVAVRPGDRVARGAVLGLIGMSGNASFPHVEFSVRHDGRPIDPFTGAAGPATDCSPRAGAAGLWSAAARDALPYRPTGIVQTGFAFGRPNREDALAGALAAAHLRPEAEALVLWADVWGTRTGDVQEFVVTGPDGGELLARRQPLERGYLSWFTFSGIRRPATGWPPGSYTGTYRLLRDGAVVEAATVTLAPPP